MRQQARGNTKNARSRLTPRASRLLSVVSHSAAQTRRWGTKLGRLLRGGEIVGLIGELGAGKTCFVRGIAEGLEVGKEAWVRSPTFTLINEYDGRLPLFHIDLFRIAGESELGELDLPGYLFAEGVSVIEWFNHLPEGEVREWLLVNFNYVNRSTRKLTFTPYGDRHEEIIKGLRHSSRASKHPGFQAGGLGGEKARRP